MASKLGGRPRHAKQGSAGGSSGGGGGSGSGLEVGGVGRGVGLMSVGVPSEGQVGRQAGGTPKAGKGDRAGATHAAGERA